MRLRVTYISTLNDGLSIEKDVYPNKFNGTVTFVRRDSEISVSAHGSCVWASEGQEDFSLPAKLRTGSV